MKSRRRGSCASSRYGSGDSPGGIALSALAIHLPLHFDLPTRLRRETRPRRTGRTPRGYPRPHGGRRPDSARDAALPMAFLDSCDRSDSRSEEHTSELQSLMRISYAVFCLKKKIKYKDNNNNGT